MFILFRSIILLSNLHNKWALAIFLCFKLLLTYCLLLNFLKMLLISLTSVLSQHASSFMLLLFAHLGCAPLRKEAFKISPYAYYFSELIFIYSWAWKSNFLPPRLLHPILSLPSWLLLKFSFPIALTVGRREWIWRVSLVLGVL